MKKTLLIITIFIFGIQLFAQKIEDLPRATVSTATDLLIIDQVDATRGIERDDLLEGTIDTFYVEFTGGTGTGWYGMRDTIKDLTTYIFMIDTLDEYYTKLNIDDTLVYYPLVTELNDTLAYYYLITDVNDTLGYYSLTTELNDTIGYYVLTTYLNDTLDDYILASNLIDSLEVKKVSFLDSTDAFTVNQTMNSSLFVNTGIGIGASAISGDLTFGAVSGDITMNTVDGSDSKRLVLSGGGAYSSARGAYINLFGNEYSGSSGQILFGAGNVANGYIDFGTGGNIGSIRILYNEDVGIGTITPSEKLEVNGNIKGATYINTVVTIADNDATPDVSGGNILIYAGSANSVTITDFDNPAAGATYTVIGNSDTYTVTINDGGNFDLNGNITLGVNDVINIYCISDNDYIQTTPFSDN